MRFSLPYFLLTLLFFIIELLIALFIKDDFIRPYFGDILVVVLIYCFIKTFFRIPVLKAVLLVLAFSFLVEFIQYLNLITVLGLENSTAAKMILGNSFAWGDLVMYVTGGILILLVEQLQNHNKKEARS